MSAVRAGACLLAAALLAGCASAPSGPASTLAPGEAIALQNPGFVGEANGRIPGWSMLEHASGNSYTFVADTEHFTSPPSSVRIRRHGREIYGIMEQRVRAKPEWANRTVRLSAYLRTQGATGTGAALMLQARNGYEHILVNDHMDDRRVRGDQPWRQYAVQFKVPPSTWWLQVGVMLENEGTLWADDVKLELVD